MNMSTRVKNRRLELQLIQKQLGDLSGITQQSIQSIEAGDIQRPRRILELSIALQCSVEWLCTGKNSHSAT